MVLLGFNADGTSLLRAVRFVVQLRFYNPEWDHLLNSPSAT